MTEARTASAGAEGAVQQAGTAAGSSVGRSSPEQSLGWLVAILLFSSLCIVTGLIWDISWHMTIGRDTLWSPPHVLEQIGAGLAGLACGFLVLRTTFVGPDAARASAVRFWGFRAPLGAWVAIWGAFAMMFSVPFDDWWHNAYGLDVEILSPPHVVLLFGMLAIQVGAMMLALRAQNRSDGMQARWYAAAYTIAAGALLAMVAIAISEYTIQPNRWHSGETWRWVAFAFPLLLFATARAGRMRFAATATALTYMAIFLVTQWILVQFPATPRLSPIVRPLTEMAAYGFPMLLVIPALVIDLGLDVLRGRRGPANSSAAPPSGARPSAVPGTVWAGTPGRLRDWMLATVLGIAFILVVVAVHWPFATFLLESPLAQNDFFLVDHWPYFNEPGDWEHDFFGAQPLLSAAFLTHLAVAAAYATLSARAGLAWGSWMSRVQR